MLVDVAAPIILGAKLHRTESVSIIFENLSDKNRHKYVSKCYIAYVKNKPVGCSVLINDVIHVFVKHYYRKKGVGRGLVRIVPEWESKVGESEFFTKLP